jgi:hypothetical protein
MIATPTLGQTAARRDSRIFTILGGTTVPDRAAIVRDHCREGSHVELRRRKGETDDSRCIDVWLECSSLLGLIKTWRLIGHVPFETAAVLSPAADTTGAVVARGTVKSVYAPLGRDEAVVTGEIATQAIP